MIISAQDGEPFHLSNRATSAKPHLVLRNGAGTEGRFREYTFPYLIFEEAVLGMPREIKAQDVLPRLSDKPSKADLLRAQLANIRRDITGFVNDLKKGHSKHLSALLVDAEKEEERLAGQLQDELARTIRPGEKAWEQLPSLVDLIRQHGDEARLKLRPLLRSIVEDARLLLVRKQPWILAGLQFHFHGGATRSYLLVYSQPSRSRPGGCWADSLASAVDPAELDLRKPDHARQFESRLGAVDLEKLTAAMHPLPGLPAGGAQA
jgi:hypothetical protein